MNKSSILESKQEEKAKTELLSQIQQVTSSELAKELQATLQNAILKHQEEPNQGEFINKEIGYIIANNQEEFVRAIFLNKNTNLPQKKNLLIILNDAISNKNLIFHSIFSELKAKNQLSEANKELLIEILKIGYGASSELIKKDEVYKELIFIAAQKLEKETDATINASQEEGRKESMTKEDLIKIGNLGYYYANGKGVSKNLKKAVRLYTLAANQGDVTAQTNLGYYYENGGLPKDLGKAAELYISAADQGHTTS